MVGRHSSDPAGPHRSAGLSSPRQPAGSLGEQAGDSGHEEGSAATRSSSSTGRRLSASPLPQQHRPLSAPVTSTSIPQLEDTPAGAAKCGQGKFTSENAAVSHPAPLKTAAAISLARLPATQAHSTPAESMRSSGQGADPTASLVAPGLNRRGWCPRLMLRG